jgi:hypothetical protein
MRVLRCLALVSTDPHDDRDRARPLVEFATKPEPGAAAAGYGAGAGYEYARCRCGCGAYAEDEFDEPAAAAGTGTGTEAISAITAEVFRPWEVRFSADFDGRVSAAYYQRCSPAAAAKSFVSSPSPSPPPQSSS